MKSLKYYGPGSIRMEDAPVPAIGTGEVLVKVNACGICATDLKTFLRGHPKIKPGSGLGHEVSGTIVESLSPQWKQGERVTVAPYVPCGVCDQCRAKRYSLCSSLFDELLEPGGFSEYVRVPPRLASQGMIEVAPDQSPFIHCFAEPVACCLHGLDSIHLGRGDSLLIIGDGVMGLLQAEIARARGANPVILSGMTPERLAMAKKVATTVIDARQDDVARTVMQATGEQGVSKIMVSVADARAAALALRLVRKGGAINLFAGMPAGSTLELDMNRIHYDEVVLTGSFGFGPDDFRAAVEMISSGALQVEQFVTAIVPLHEATTALEKLARQEGIKTIVLCNAGGDR